MKDIKSRRVEAILEFVEKCSSNEVSLGALKFRALLVEKMKDHPLFAGLSEATYKNTVGWCARNACGKVRATRQRVLTAPQISAQTPTKDSLVSLDDIMARFPLTLGEVDELKPLLKRIRKFLLPYWEQITSPCVESQVRKREQQLEHRIENLERELSDLNRQHSELEEKHDKLLAAHALLQKRAEMFQREAEKRRTAFDIERHGVIDSRAHIRDS